jgi:BNR/Asp-box repeat protein
MSRDFRFGIRQVRWSSALVLVAGVAVALMAVARAADDDRASQARKARLPMSGGGSAAIVAKSLGVKEIMGKTVETGSGEDEGKKTPGLAARGSVPGVSASRSGLVSDGPPAGSPNNFVIRDFPNVSEDEPTVAANPRNPTYVVAGSHFIGDTGNRCVAHYSRDGGKTWNVRPIFMPMLTHSSECSDPILAYAPDGSRVYYAYIDIDFSDTFKILVSYSDDNGKSWKGPVVALSAPVTDYDKPWIGTHVPVGGDDHSYQGNSNWVYVTATRFPFFTPDCSIDFTRSSNKGTSWSAPQRLDIGNCAGSSGPSTTTQVVQGSRPSGGLGGGVLVAWYHSGLDGWLSGTFQIRTRYSANNGATFNPVVVSSSDATELSFYLGPLFAYHRWWGGMFPDVEVAPDRSAHIVYTTDPVPGPETAEEGDIRYVTSVGPPYATWSIPATVNDDNSGRAQGWATLEATTDNRGTRVVYALWEDHRTSDVDNRQYDIFWTKKVGHGLFAENEKLTDQISTSDFIFLGDYFDITVARGGDDDHRGDPFVYAVWTDRRDEPSIFDFDDDVWGARIPPAERHDDNDDDDDWSRHH